MISPDVYDARPVPPDVAASGVDSVSELAVMLTLTVELAVTVTVVVFDTRAPDFRYASSVPVV
jgi:hypothetical protein